MPLNKKDFIEIEFTGRVKDGEVFDSNIKEVLEKMHAGHDHPITARPFIFCLGENMFLKAIEDFLIGKEMGEYEIELEPEKAFGKRDQKLIKMMPLDVFTKHQMNPVSGFMFEFDGRVGKVLTVSGGRVTVDFNHPLAGKTVIYDIKVVRQVMDINEKIAALNHFFFKRDDLAYRIDGNNIILNIEAPMAKFAELLKEKYKEMLGFELQINPIQVPEKQDTENKKSQ
jgi:FKBP-type peptidyl-prolyl cis-trans isomerase 2